MRIASDGNVGIGTTSPSEKLEVDGNIKSKRITLSHSGYAGYINQAGDFGGGPLYIRNQGQNHDINFQGNKGGTTSTSLHIDGLTHNVGIGTTSPSSKLHIKQSVDSIDGGLTWESVDGTQEWSIDANNAGNFRIYKGTTAVARFDSSGNFGIGTSSPAAKLHVEGTVKAGDSSTGISLTIQSTDEYRINGIDTAGAGWNSLHLRADGTDGLFIQKDTNNVGIGTTSPASKLHVVGADGTYQTRIGHSTQSLYLTVDGANVDYKSSGNSSGSHSFSTGNTERVRITSSGNVGIGTTSPSQKLHVDGNTLISAERYYYVAGGGAGVGSDASGNLILRQNSANLMTTSGSNATFAGNLKLGDSNQLQLGNDADLVFYSDNTQTLMHNYNNNLIIKQDATDGDIIFQSDNGSGGTTEYYRIDGGSNLNVFSKNILLADSKQALFGNNSDLRIYHNGTNSNIEQLYRYSTDYTKCR